MWDHVFLREASFLVGFVAACKWPMLSATPITLQNKMSVGLYTHSCVIAS